MTFRSFLIVVWVLGTVGLPAQVPDGHFVVSSLKLGNPPPNLVPPPPGDGGLWCVHPRQPGPPVPVTGLPQALTGTGTTGVNLGANCVLRRPADEALIVGTAAPSGSQVGLHVIQLAGLQALPGGTVIPLGTGSSSTIQVTQCALVPGGDVLVGVLNVTSGPLGGFHVGRVNPTTGSVVGVVPAASISGWVNALAVDASGTTAYLGMWQSWSLSHVYAVSVAGGTPTWIASIPNGITGLSFDNNGDLVAACGADGVLPSLYRIPLTGGPVPMPTVRAGLAGVAVERATGMPVHVDRASGTAEVWVGSTLLTAGPTGGWGVLSGIDINHDPEPYGAPTDGANAYAWSWHPSTYGLPVAGGLYGATVLGAPGCGPLVFGVSLAKTPPTPLGGVVAHIALDPANLVLSGALPCSGGTATVGPYQTAPFMQGLSIYLQVAELGPQGFAAATSGLHVTFL